MTNFSDLITQRRDEFGEEYGDGETSELVNLLIAAGDFLERLTWEPDAVGKAMKHLFETTSGYPAGQDRPWREVWIDAWSELGVFKSSDYFVGLNSFAFYGLCPDTQFYEVSESDVATKAALGEWIGKHIQKGRDLLSATPSKWANIEELDRTVLAAEARLNLDFDRDVTVEQLAALSKMTAKSIRNLLTPKSGDTDLQLNERGGIPAVDALRWLGKRSDFRTSIWWIPVEDAAEIVMPDEKRLGDVVFVPYAKDGSWFHPSRCRNSRGYTIGPKGSERPVSDYFEALEALARSPTPHWRRPNSAGNWGIVAGVNWQRKELSEIKKCLEEGVQA